MLVAANSAAMRRKLTAERERELESKIGGRRHDRTMHAFRFEGLG